MKELGDSPQEKEESFFGSMETVSLGLGCKLVAGRKHEGNQEGVEAEESRSEGLCGGPVGNLAWTSIHVCM